MTDYSQLNDADINAAIAVRVMGWTLGEVTIEHERDSHSDYTTEAWMKSDGDTARVASRFRPSKNLDDCFLAQSALAAKGVEYIRHYSHNLYADDNDEHRIQEVVGWRDFWRIANTNARNRCIAMLQAVDACEGKS